MPLPLRLHHPWLPGALEAQVRFMFVEKTQIYLTKHIHSLAGTRCPNVLEFSEVWG